MTKEEDSFYLPTEIKPLWGKLQKANGQEEIMPIIMQIIEKSKTLPKAQQKRLQECLDSIPSGVILKD